MNTDHKAPASLVDRWLEQLEHVPWRSFVTRVRWRKDKTPKGRRLRVMTGCPRRLFDDDRFLPTPAQRDFKDTGDPTMPWMLEAARRRRLGAVLVVSSGKPGALNSEFAAALMGFPRNWLIA